VGEIDERNAQPFQNNGESAANRSSDFEMFVLSFSGALRRYEQLDKGQIDFRGFGTLNLNRRISAQRFGDSGA